MHLRGRHPQLSVKWRQHRAEDIAIPLVAYAELLVGAEKSSRPDQVFSRLNRCLRPMRSSRSPRMSPSTTRACGQTWRGEAQRSVVTIYGSPQPHSPMALHSSLITPPNLPECPTYQSRTGHCRRLRANAARSPSDGGDSRPEKTKPPKAQKGPAAFKVDKLEYEPPGRPYSFGLVLRRPITLSPCLY